MTHTLVPVPSGLARPTDKLCNFCTALRLKPDDFIVRPGSGGGYYPTPERSFGLIHDIKAKSAYCPLCRLVLQSLGTSVPDEQDGEPIEATISWDTAGIVSNPNDSSETLAIVREITTSVQRQGGADCDHQPVVNARIGILANDAPVPNKSLFPRIIKEQIDFEMVRGWLDVCERHHTLHCGGVHPDLRRDDFVDIIQEIPSLRMIDVVDQCITLAPHNCKYIALSYVWGRIDPQKILRTLKANIVALEKPGSLTKPEFYDKIPITIRDAMLVVKELHMRYLWVDSLCIIQDDDGDGGSKMEAIAKMAYVYGAASLTITAASGIDANAGLPGVRSGADRKQPIEEIGPGFRLAFKQMWQYYDSSVYYTRGWTYQEGHFARRNLLFIGGQVVFSCVVTDQCREDEVLEELHATYSYTSRGNSLDNIGEVEDIIIAYTTRSLTYDGDIYNAIAAMLVVFKRVIDASLCHGIPDVFFDWFLLWQSGGLQQRRSIAPSWSWSGWIGPSLTGIWTSYTRSINKVRKAQKKRTWIIWYQRKAHDSYECVRVNTVKTPGEDSASARRLQKLFPFDCGQTFPTPRKLTDAPLYIEDRYYPHPGSGFLQFWTISIMLDLDKLAVTTQEMMNDLKFGHSYAGIFGRDGWDLGNIMLDSEWFAANVPGRHEFIVICEGRIERPKRLGDEDKEPGWMYRIVLIAWRGEGQWAERVAVGAIEKDDLDEALEPGPVWKEIVLG